MTWTRINDFQWHGFDGSFHYTVQLGEHSWFASTTARGGVFLGNFAGAELAKLACVQASKEW